MMPRMEEKKALSVSQFLQGINFAFEDTLFPEGAVVEGEVVEYRISQGKWIWFSLKDETGILSCFATVWQLKQPLEDGMQVRAHGMPKIHQKSGRFSLTVDRVEMVGEGALKRAFELLKKKLIDEGVFAEERKRPIPRFPERIGLIASTESAAYTDFLKILGNRWGGIKVLATHVLVLTRGGGSMEDLHAFNSEEVTRAVFSSKIPVVVGIGHERDESLAEYAADVRASTPSNAAERMVPDREDIEWEIRSKLSDIEGVLQEWIGQRERKLYEIEAFLQEKMRAETMKFQLLINKLKMQFIDFEGRIKNIASSLVRDVRLLKSLDPQAVLKRGFSITRDENGKLVRDAGKVDKDSFITVQLQKGILNAQIHGKKI